MSRLDTLAITALLFVWAVVAGAPSVRAADQVGATSDPAGERSGEMDAVAGGGAEGLLPGEAN
jgi:hypothetical protein